MRDLIGRSGIRVAAVLLLTCSFVPDAGSAPQQVPPAGSPRVAVPIAVLPLGLSAQTAERYPQLADRNVGLGVHNMLVNRLDETGRFRFVEDKPEIIDDLVKRQWISASGGVSQDSAVEYGQLLGARYVLYGEVYDFSSQKIAKKIVETRISLQVRLVDVETSEYIPASGKGTVARKGEVFTAADPVEFARSTVGQASEAALDEAVERLMERFWPGH